jgi:hypothetical protein
MKSDMEFISLARQDFGNILTHQPTSENTKEFYLKSQINFISKFKASNILSILHIQTTSVTKSEQKYYPLLS